MKAEIAAYGPISCSYEETDKMVDVYKPGMIYSEKKAKIETNHIIAVVGYGYDDESKREYWIARNSIGTWWGDNGFFKM